MLAGATAGDARLVERRAAHEPLSYLTGRKEFWSLDLEVDRSTLIPRPATETLVEMVLELLPARDRPYRLLDLGTGTGCILLALLTEFPQAHGLGVDLEPAAVRLAKRNAAAVGVAERSDWRTSDWFQGLAGLAADVGARPFDVITANPPYIGDDDWASLAPTVRQFEPRLALDGGRDGLAAYRAIAAQAPAHMTPTTMLVVEIGIHQAEPVRLLDSLGRGRRPRHVVTADSAPALALRLAGPGLGRGRQVKAIMGAHNLACFAKREDLASFERCLAFRRRGA